MCITFLIFVPWKKGPAWYLKISDKIFYIMLLTNYIILPAVNNIATCYFIFNPDINLKQESIESYIIFFNIVCFMRLIEYFIIVRRTVLLDAKNFMSIKADMEAKTAEQIEEEMLNETGGDNETQSKKNV